MLEKSFKPTAESCSEDCWLPKRNWSGVLFMPVVPFLTPCVQIEVPASHGIFCATKSDDSRPLFHSCCVCGEFWVVSQRNKHKATAHPPLLPRDSIGSVASRSKSCLLFPSPHLMPPCLVVTAFFKNILECSL